MQLQLPSTLNSSKLTVVGLHTVLGALVKTWLFSALPLALPGRIVVILRCWTADCLRTSDQLRTWLGLPRASAERTHPPAYRTLRDAAEEAEYWRSSERTRRVLQASDANSMPENVPLVRYYVPKLLPVYREVAVEDGEATEVCLSPRAFAKWHGMVFPAAMHPTTREAKEQIKHYSSRDRKEILRMSRLVSDEEVIRCGERSCGTRYTKMWQDWLEAKGPDVAIVFE